MKSNIKQSVITAAVMLAVLALASCVTTTAPDGTVTEKPDQEAINPWMLLVRDIFVKPAAPVAPIVVEPEK